MKEENWRQAWGKQQQQQQQKLKKKTTTEEERNEWEDRIKPITCIKVSGVSNLHPASFPTGHPPLLSRG